MPNSPKPKGGRPTKRRAGDASATPRASWTTEPEGDVPAPSDYFREQLVGIRKRRGWSQDMLAERLSAIGWSIDRSTLEKIESTPRKVTLDEVFAFARALEVSPAALMLPHSWEKWVQLAPTERWDAGTVLRWLRGERQLPFLDERPFAGEIPDEQFESYRRYPDLRAIHRDATDMVSWAAHSDDAQVAMLLRFVERRCAVLADELDSKKKGK